MKIRLLFNQVLVKPNEVTTKTESGILLSGNFKEYDTGTVVAVGPGRYDKGILIPTFVQPGHVIAYRPHSGMFMTDEAGVKHTLLPEEAIIGILE